MGQIYRYQIIYPRLLRLKSSPIPPCRTNSKSPLTGQLSRLASSTRDAKDKNRDKRTDRDEGDWDQELREHFKQVKKDYNSFVHLMREDREKAFDHLQDWIERDPYHALFGSREARGAWNPWAESWPWSDRSQNRGKHDEAKTNAPSVPDKRDAAKQTSKEMLAQTHNGRETSRAHTPQRNLASEEYTIDPITLRKVPKPKVETAKSSSPSQSTSQPKAATGTKSIDITAEVPVKKFASPISDLGKEEIAALRPANGKPGKLAGFASQPWLVREGFTPSSRSFDVDDKGKTPKTKVFSAVKSERIEPALNRVLNSIGRSKPSLEYNTSENKTEDIDLLRASDVRAASGHTKPKGIPSPEEARERREKLEGRFAEVQKKHSDEINSVLPLKPNEKAKQRYHASTVAAVSDSSSSAITKGEYNMQNDSARGEQGALTEPNIQTLHLLHEQLQRNLKRSAELLQKAKKEALDRKLEGEISSLRKAFDSFENRKREHFATTEVSKGLPKGTPPEQSIHNKVQDHKERDMALIREIREIYEDKYGPIDAAHKQAILNETPVVTPPAAPELEARGTPQETGAIQTSPSKSVGPEVLPGFKVEQERTKSPQLATAEDDQAKTAPVHEAGKTKLSPDNTQHAVSTEQAEAIRYVYRILAMDRVKQTVAAATTSSSLFPTSSPLRSASDILTHLDQPYKYFDHMGKLESQGFELIAGTRNVLVYRKQLKQRPVAELEKTAHTQPHPVPPSSAVRSSPGPAEEPDEVEELAEALKPWREESVFSGRPSPRDRCVRAYERAETRERASRSSRAKSAAEETIAAQDKLSQSIHTLNSSKPLFRSGRAYGVVARAFGKFLKNLGAVSAIAIMLYLVGVWQDRRMKQEKEEKERVDMEKERQRKRREPSWLLS